MTENKNSAVSNLINTLENTLFLLKSYQRVKINSQLKL